MSPLTIETSPAEEIIIKDHFYVFQSNGFKLEYLDNETVLPGRRIRLLALPYSKNIEFGVNDVHELASILSETVDTNNDLFIRNTSSKNLIEKSIKLPKILSMFASRACRSSVMIGTSLTTNEMRKIVDNLKDIEQPWNCPHGRPTMRHLAHLPSVLNHSSPGTSGKWSNSLDDYMSNASRDNRDIFAYRQQV